jgi:hypothetical protein
MAVGGRSLSSAGSIFTISPREGKFRVSWAGRGEKEAARATIAAA